MTPTSSSRLAWAALAAWLIYSAAGLAWWFLQDPARYQAICRSIAP